MIQIPSLVYSEMQRPLRPAFRRSHSEPTIDKLSSPCIVEHNPVLEMSLSYCFVLGYDEEMPCVRQDPYNVCWAITKVWVRLFESFTGLDGPHYDV